MIDYFHFIFIPVLASGMVSLLACWRGYLTVAAAITAGCLGAVILSCAGIAAASSVAVCFFITALLSRRRETLQGNMDVRGRSRRDFGQILANASLLTVIAVLIGISSERVWLLAFLGCIGAVAGDTWASDLARFSHRQARLITTLRAVAPGTPGAVTGFGCLLSAAAGLLAGAVFFVTNTLLARQQAFDLVDMLLVSVVAGIGGMLGALVDSLLGATVQAIYQRADGSLTDHPREADTTANQYLRGWRWLNNDMVNFANSLAGALSAALIGGLWFYW